VVLGAIPSAVVPSPTEATLDLLRVF